MKVMRKILTLSMIFVFMLSACNLNNNPGNDANLAAASTIVALTLTAAAAQPVVLNSPVPADTATPSFTTLLLTDNTNCRQGPGKNFSIVSVIAGGVSVQIVARSEDGKFWVVAAPNNAGACWVSAEFGTASGNTNLLPIVTPAAGESISGAPERPGSLYYNYSCNGGDVTTTLTWADAADNEDGYRLYRYGALIADLPANTTSYLDNVIVSPGATIEYSLEAYNGVGVSEPRAGSFSCK
jgi:hypothetical protein